MQPLLICLQLLALDAQGRVSRVSDWHAQGLLSGGRVSPGAKGEKGDRKQARKARRDARRGPEAAPAPLPTPQQLQAVNARPIGEQRAWVSTKALCVCACR